MATSSVELAKGSAILHVEGDAVVDCATALHISFCEALDTQAQVVLDTDRVTECDLSFLQLMGSLCHSLSKGERSLTLYQDRVSEVVRKAIHDAGLQYRENCVRLNNRECLFSTIAKSAPSEEKPLS